MARLLVLLAFLASAASAQISRGILYVASDPAGTCSNGSNLRYNFNNGKLWGCKSGTWTALTSGSGAGTVTSVGLSLPSIFTVTGSPVTTAGTLTGNFNTQLANLVFSGPSSGGAAIPTFRSLVTADMPAGTGTVTSFSAGNLSPLFTTSVATATTTPALTFALSTAAAQTGLRGPSAYGAAAAAPTYRTLTPQDIPAAFSACAGHDNSICTSSVDANGNPNFLTTAANTVLPINGGTTPLVMYIGGAFQQLNTNVTLTVPSTASVPQWILAVQDLTNANMVAGDFLAMNTAPAYAYTAPTCPSPSPALSATNPAFWYDLSTNLSKTCTSNGGAYSANPSLVLGVVWVDATPKVLAVAMNPYRLNPYKRFETFGNGTDGTLTVTSGTTTIDTHKQYASVIVSAGTLQNSGPGSNVTVGVSVQSQNPILVFGTGTVKGNGLAGTGGGTGAGPASSAGGYGGRGGGGGGSGTVSAAGATGGSGLGWERPTTVVAGGAGGAATPTAGTAGLAAWGGNAGATIPLLFFTMGFYGTTGGAGAGDATNNGGNGGNAGGAVWMKGPSIVVDTGGTVQANGTNGTNGVAGNAGGGGGGGGGTVVLSGGYLNTANGTVTASGGTAGTGSGTGQAGGAGGAGLVQLNRLW